MQPPPDDRIVAAKISLSHEPSAVVLVRRIEEMTGDFDMDAKRWASTVRYVVTTAERLPVGSSQVAIADIIADLVALADIDRAERCSVVVDITTPGLPFLGTLRDRKIRAAAVMVGDANKPRADARIWQLPMRELLAITMGLMTDGRLEVADIDQAEKLVEQLEAFRTKQPPRDALSDWRPIQHADLAHALMLAAWWSERMLRPIIKQPPAPRVPVEPGRPPTFDQVFQAVRRQRRADRRGLAR